MSTVPELCIGDTDEIIKRMSNAAAASSRSTDSSTHEDNFFNIKKNFNEIDTRYINIKNDYNYKLDEIDIIINRLDNIELIDKFQHCRDDINKIDNVFKELRNGFYPKTTNLIAKLLD